MSADRCLRCGAYLGRNEGPYCRECWLEIEDRRNRRRR